MGISLMRRAGGLPGHGVPVLGLRLLGTYGPSSLNHLAPWKDTDIWGDIQLPMPPPKGQRAPRCQTSPPWEVAGGAVLQSMGAGGSRTGLRSVGLSCRLPKSLKSFEIPNVK